MKKQLQDIYDKVQCIAATNVAQHLVPYVQRGVTSAIPSLNVVTSATSSFSMMPATPSSISAVQPATAPAPSAVTLATDPNTVTCVPSSSVNASSPTTSYRMIPPVISANPIVPINAVAVPPVDAVTEPVTSSQDLLTQAEITPIYVKSRNRRNFAALLVERLFDVETRLKSNVSGRQKEKLDPEIIKYVRAKAFQYYECNSTEKKTEWAKCVLSIDDKSRSLKKRKSL